MPPKPKITKEMIIHAAFEIARAEGYETINARTVAQKLSCSTQPVLYYFSKIEEIKQAAYEKSDAYHSWYLIHDMEKHNRPLTEIGLRYVRFAHEEQRLFRFLFQSGKFSGTSLPDLINSEELTPVLAMIQQNAQTNAAQTRNIFLSVFLFLHGCASMLANNAMKYNEAAISFSLKQTYLGAIYASTTDDHIQPFQNGD